MTTNMLPELWEDACIEDEERDWVDGALYGCEALYEDVDSDENVRVHHDDAKHL